MQPRITALLLLALLGGASALIHDAAHDKDPRRVYRIETFGFDAGGTAEIKVTGYKTYFHDDYVGEKQFGFIMRRCETESQAVQEWETALQNDGACFFDDEGREEYDIVMDMSPKNGAESESEHAISHVFTDEEQGLYTLLFIRCSPEDESWPPTSYHMHIEFKNSDGFLSAGESPLPNLFFAIFVVFAFGLVAWIVLLRKAGRGQVHHIHHLMTVLLVLKTLSMLFESIRYHYIKTYGDGEGWDIVYYVFAFLKGVMLFVVILLIGTGWSFVKPFLNDREKKIVFVVLVMQVIDNIAMVVIEEASPGTRAYITWRDILHLVDILCCCAILFPIVWSIRHLRQAVAADGQAERSIAKLTLFRQFYIMVVTYVYFTRIVVYLLAATLPFHVLWMRYFFSEAATIAFYFITGWKFRPQEQNPYISVPHDDDDALEEFGLDDDGMEMTDQSELRVAV